MLAGIGSVALATTATTALLALSGPLFAAVALGGLQALTLFGVLLLARQIRRHRRRLVEIEGEGVLLSEERIRNLSTAEVANVRRLREDESNILEMIAGDQPTKEVFSSITAMLSRHYRHSRFRIVNDTLFDSEDVDATWEILPRTNRDLGWVLQGLVGPGDEIEPDVADMATDLARLAIDKARNQSSLRYQAAHDALTGLLSRRAVLATVEKGLQTSDSIGLIYCDVDKFKEINDTLGHQAGDELLIGISTRLLESIEQAPFDCHAGRLGGDEFLLVAIGAEHKQLLKFAKQVSFDMQAPFSVESGSISTSLSIGMSFHRHGEGSDCVRDPGEMLGEADIALYEVKRSGRNGVRLFDAALKGIEEERKLLEQDLRQAIKNRSGLFTDFQPQFDQDKQLVGFEALVRWDRHEVGLVSPGDFIPVAVERNMMAQLDLEVFRTVAQTVASLRREGRKFGKVAVNVSAERLEDPKFVESTLDVLRRSSIDPTTVVLEITESSLLNDLRERGRRLEELRAWGIRIAIDDFGTGYSSLSYLRDLPVDIVKLDREFVSDIDSSVMSQAIVQAILTLSKALDLEVVAEGIERESQLRVLSELGCDVFQGFLLGKPLSLDDARALAQRRWAADPFTGGYDWPEVPPNAQSLERFAQLPEFKTF